MKKFFTAFVLVLALCLTSVPAFAADLTQDVSTGNTTVYHRVGNITDVHDPNNPTDDEIAGTYTVSIPAYIEAAAQEQVPAEQEVSAFDVLLPYGTKLLVSVDFENHLSLLNHESVTVEYQMLANGNRITAGDTILSVPAGNPDAVNRTSVASVLSAKTVYAGMYTDTATFTISAV